MQRVKQASWLIRYKDGDLTASRLLEKLARCLFLEEPFYLKLWGSLAAAWGISAFLSLMLNHLTKLLLFTIDCQESFRPARLGASLKQLEIVCTLPEDDFWIWFNNNNFKK